MSVRTRGVLLGLLTLSCLPLATLTASAASNGSLGIRLLDAPTNRRDDPRALTYIVDHLKPGTTISRRLEVSNDTSATKHINVYPDAATIKGGAFVPGDGRTESELTQWTTVTPTALDLTPHAKATVTVVVKVPADAAPGERYGVVLAELPATAGKGVLQSARVGVRMYLSVGPGNEPASDFTVDTLQANRLPDGTPVVYALVHNTGGRAVDMSGSLRLTNGPGGLSAGPFTAKLGTTLAPKDTEPVTVVLDKALPAGPWSARIDLASGLIKRAATATITFPAAAGPGNDASASPVVLQQNSEKSGLPLVPILGVAAGVGVIGLLMLVVFKRPKRRRGNGGHGKHGR